MVSLNVSYYALNCLCKNFLMKHCIFESFFCFSFLFKFQDTQQLFTCTISKMKRFHLVESPTHNLTLWRLTSCLVSVPLARRNVLKMQFMALLEFVHMEGMLMAAVYSAPYLLAFALYGAMNEFCQTDRIA